MINIIKDLIWAGFFSVKLFIAIVIVLFGIFVLIAFDHFLPYVLIALIGGGAAAILEECFKNKKK